MDMNNQKTTEKTNAKKTRIQLKRPLALVIAAAVVIAAAAGGAVSVLSHNRARTVEAMQTYVNSEDSQEKSETVYVIADADGGVKKVIVSDWLKHSSQSKSITEADNLDALKQSDAEQGYTINSGSANSWDADGGSYYQQVESGENLPVDVRLSYALDGKKMTADEIAGKSGKVTIRFDYTNNQKQTVSIDGADTAIYVPFTVVTGTILNNDTFSNVQVSNGKVINDGTRSIVLGFALPGMAESLNLRDDTLELPDAVEITADVKNFELTTTLTMVSNDLFNEAAEDVAEKKNESTLSLDSLTAGLNRLTDGTAALYTGTSELLDKSGLLIDGVNQLAAGGQELAGDVETVNAALSLLCTKGTELNSGAQTLFQTVLASTQSSIEPLRQLGISFNPLTPDNYGTELRSVLAQVSYAKANIQSLMAQQQAAAAAANGSPATDSAQNTDSPASTDDAPNQNTSDEENIPSEESSPDTADDQNNATAPEPMQQDDPTDDGSTPNDENNENNEADGAASSGAEGTSAQQLATAYAALEQAEKTLPSTIALLDGIGQLCQGIQQYTGGVQQVYDGSVKLKDGADQLSSGLNQLQNSSGALVDGISQLNDGAMQLSEGVGQLSGGGLASMLSASSGVNLSQLRTRLDAMRDVSAAYNSYTGGANETGTVKFIYRTDSVSAND